MASPQRLPAVPAPSLSLTLSGKPESRLVGQIPKVNSISTLLTSLSVTGTCECVSTLGPALGGGHGWLQGHHGLVADQFLSMNIVLANGTLVTIDESSDLWWAVKGAGHNFGIVTSVNVKVYDIEHSNWAVETLIFSGDKVEEVYQAANDHLLKNGTQSADVVNWSYWLNNPDADAENVSDIRFTYIDNTD